MPSAPTHLSRPRHNGRMHSTLSPHREGAPCAPRFKAAAPLFVLLLVPAVAAARAAPAADAPAVDTPATEMATGGSLGAPPLPVGVPPPETPGIPTDQELEASGAVV